MDSKNTNTGSIGFSGALFLVFLTLKLTGYITWSWWWVTAPLWIPVSILLVIALIAGIVCVIFK